MTQHGDYFPDKYILPSACCGFSSKFEPPLFRIVFSYPDRILYWRPHVRLKSRWFTGAATARCVVQPLVQPPKYTQKHWEWVIMAMRSVLFIATLSENLTPHIYSNT